MADLIAFRPRMGTVRLKKIAQQMNYPNVSRFIEDAILEKVQHEVHSEKSSEVQKLNDAIGKLILKHLGVRGTDLGSKLVKVISPGAKDARAGKRKSDLKQLFDDTQHHRYVRPEEK